MSDMRRRWWQTAWGKLAAAVGVLVVAWVVFFGWEVVQSIILIRSGRPPVEEAQQRQLQASVGKLFANTNVTAADLARIEQGTNPTLGNPKAKVRIVEFLDYDCPFCRKSASVVRDFMRTHANDAYLIIRDFPLVDLHPEAERVAVAARCVFVHGDVNRYWSYHDRLFASQEAHAPDDLLLYAQQLGVDTKRFETCRSAAEPLSLIKSSQADGLAAGVEGTPTFFFNGVKVQGALGADTMEAIFQTAAKKAGAGL